MTNLKPIVFEKDGVAAIGISRRCRTCLRLAMPIAAAIAKLTVAEKRLYHHPKVVTLVTIDQKSSSQPRVPHHLFPSHRR